MRKRFDQETIQWILEKSRGHLRDIVVLAVGDSLFALASILFVLASRGIIDSAVAADRGGVIRFGSALAGAMLFQLLIWLFLRSLRIRLTARLTNHLRKDSLSTLLNKEFGPVSAFHSGELLNRLFSDVEIVIEGIVSIFPDLVYLATKLATVLTVLAILDPRFALIFVVFGILFLSGSFLFRGQLKQLHSQVQEMSGLVRSFFQEAVESILVIKVFGSEQKILREADKRQTDSFLAQMRRKNFSVTMSAGYYFIFQLSYFFAVIWGARGIFLQTLSFGTFTALVQLVGQIQSPLTMLSGMVPRFYGVIASAERLIELEKIPDEDAADDPASEFHAMEVSEVAFSYGRTPVLTGVSYGIRAGDFVALTGRSGGGKSTQFLLLLGAYEPQSGEIRITTDRGVQRPGRNNRHLFAYVPQGNYLFSGTVAQNIAFINESATADQIAQAAHLACAEGFIGEMPQGYETLIGEKGFGLSEGQAQRIAIARALLSSAPVLLLDEATSALDEKTEERLLKNIAGLQNRTCLIVTHRQAALAICTKQLLIEENKVTLRDLKPRRNYDPAFITG